MARLLVHPERLIDYGIRLSNRQRQRLEATGRFPRRVPVAGRSHAYIEEELLAYIDRCISARDGTTAEAA